MRVFPISELVRLMLLLLIFTCCISAPGCANSQSVETVHKYETEKHIGLPEDALVGIIVTQEAADGTSQVRHGNGIFIRCDGFILAPDALFNTANSNSQKINKPDQQVTVVLHPGTDHEKQMKSHSPRYTNVLDAGTRFYKIPYTVLKMDDLHYAAPRLLSPDAVEPNDTLRVVYSAWSNAAGRFMPLQSVTAIAGPKIEDSPLPFISGITASAQLFARQISKFAQPVPLAPNGAIVVGSDNMVVGVVTDSAGSSTATYANLAAMESVTNSVAVETITDRQFADMLSRLAKGDDVEKGGATRGNLPIAAADAQKRIPLRAHSDMVPVAGGPVKVPSVLQAYDSDLESVYDACIPPFLIDKYEVTNAQYLEFWNSLPEAFRKDTRARAEMYPYGWGAEPAPFSADLSEVPVLGVRLAGAKAYAKWAGKRLPTPLEWCLAAFGRYGGNRPPEWAGRYMKDRSDAWDKIIAAHMDYAHQHPEVVPGFSYHTDITADLHVDTDWSRPVAEEFCQLPWFFMRPGFAAAAAWSHDCVRQNTSALFKDWIDPGYVLSVGSRPYDVSPYGAYDMIMNARELVIPGPHGLWKSLPNGQWPFGDVDRYMEVDWVQGGLFRQPWFRAADASYDIGNSHISDHPIILGNGLALIDIDRYIKTTPIYNTNLLISHPAHTEPGGISTIVTNPGPPFVDSAHPLASIDAPIPAEADSRWLGLYHPVAAYEFRMPSRRIYSASQNVQAGSAGFVAADLGDYVNACGAVQEYSEQLRPVDTCMLNLVAGPYFNTPYWTSTGTWGYGSTFQISQSTPARRVGKIIIRGNSIGDVGLNEWMADATCIAETGAYASWSGGPDHFHKEIGRPLAVDARYPLNARLTSQIGQREFAPDTFLIPGGFRCAR